MTSLVLLALLSIPRQFPVLGRGIPMASNSGSGTLLAAADLTCDGAFLSPAESIGAKSTQNPVAARMIAGTRNYYVVRGSDGHVIQFTAPSLGSCSTAVGSLPSATAGTDWGLMPNDGSDGYVLGTPTHPGEIFGLTWDETSGEMIESWAATYANVPVGVNSFSAATFGASSFTTVGCWGVASTGQTITGTGLVNIASSFVGSYLSAGQRWGLGFGGPLASAGAGVSLGPSLIATAPPSGNSCSGHVDTDVPSTTILAQFQGTNTTGPNCVAGGGTYQLGCTAAPAPTSPYAAKIALTNYSTAMFANFWDPYGGHGWFATAAPVMTWYDDGTKQGVVTAFETSEGWANTTVSGATTPSSDGTTATFTATSTSTNDGLNMQGASGQLAGGDRIWVQTCTPGVGGCLSANGNWLSFLRVTSVNTSTGAITAHVDSTDGLGGSTPVVGGAIYFGGYYAQGTPQMSRGVFRLQIIDPAQYATVVQGGDPSLPTYHEDVDLQALGAKGFGTGPISDGWDGYTGAYRPVSIISDTTNQKIIIVFRNAVSTPQQDAIYIFSVSHTP